MTPGIKPLVAGNWKMNGFRNSLNELSAMGAGYCGELRDKVDMAVCTPSTLLYTSAVTVVGSGIRIGGQDCHFNESGAHTGDISASMLFDCGATFVIVGHSERRTDHGETSELVRSKADAALKNALIPIICIGETEEQRKSGETLKVLEDQLAGSLPVDPGNEIVIAYEPVWAIGTGLVPSIENIAEAHKFIREFVIGKLGQRGETTRLLYGGSVKPGNAAELMGIDHVDGALVGGASLKAEDFLGICRAF